jgi:hypothetical protein
VTIAGKCRLTLLVGSIIATIVSGDVSFNAGVVISVGVWQLVDSPSSTQPAPKVDPE